MAANLDGRGDTTRPTGPSRAIHDLRNHLAVILNSAEALRQRHGEGQPSAEVEAIHQATLACVGLLGALEAGPRSDSAEQPSQPTAGAAPALPSEAATVLVVEDDRLLGDMLANWLRQGGHQARLARNGREALARLREGPVDLLVVDYRLPDTDGLALLHRARPLIGGAVVALVSGSLLPATPGVDVVLTKPVRPPVWRDLVDRALAVKRQREAAP